MVHNSIKNDLQNLFSGKGEVRFGATIQAITNYLEKGASTSQEIKDFKFVKNQEAEKLEVFISENNLWKEVDFDRYVSEGAEQKAYLLDAKHLMKLNVGNRKNSPLLSYISPTGLRRQVITQDN
jgi:hypothetical protein